jgi:hypothetical protein
VSYEFFVSSDFYPSPRETVLTGDRKMADKTVLTAAQKKARYRKKMRAAGFKEISVWVAPEQAETVRQFAETLPKPSKPDAEGQANLFEILGGQSDG